MATPFPADRHVRFIDRTDAGRALAGQLQRYADRSDVVVLALPRGGVPVAREVADALNAPLDVFVVRKLGLPGRPELAMGAIASGGVRVLNEDVLAWIRPPASAIDAVTQQEQIELERRERAYRDGRPPASVDGRIAVLIDDGLATGSTMRGRCRPGPWRWPGATTPTARGWTPCCTPCTPATRPAPDPTTSPSGWRS